MYGCGVAAIVLQYLYTRSIAGATGGQLSEVVRTAGYSVDPFIEEIIKVLPLFIAGLHLRARRQLGLTDFLLLGAAIGAGCRHRSGVNRSGCPTVPG